MIFKKYTPSNSWKKQLIQCRKRIYIIYIYMSYMNIDLRYYSCNIPCASTIKNYNNNVIHTGNAIRCCNIVSKRMSLYRVRLFVHNYTYIIQIPQIFHAVVYIYIIYVYMPRIIYFIAQCTIYLWYDKLPSTYYDIIVSPLPETH